MAKNGNNILVYSGSTLIACTKSNEVQTDCDTIEVSSPMQGSWETFITGRKKWSVTVSYLVVDDSVLGISGGTGVRDLLQVGNTFTLHFKNRSSNDSSGVSGTAILKTVKINAVRGNLATGSFQFLGTGALT